MDEIMTPQQPVQPQSQKTHPFWQHFSKQTLLLIVVLFLFTGGLVYLAIRQEQPTKTISVVPTPTPSPAHATLTFVPQTSSAGKLQTVDVTVSGNGNSIAGVQLAVGYDPKVLTNVSVKPGTFFTNPTPLFNTIDKTNGRIFYVLAISPSGTPTTGSGVVATISYTILPTSETTTKLTFLPKTELTQEGILGSVLKSTADLTIAIPEDLQISPTASSSGR